MNESIRNSRAPVIVDLGKKRKKAVKSLRRGQGKLMEDVHSAVDELKSSGTVAKDAQVLIVVVESKAKKASWTSCWM